MKRTLLIANILLVAAFFAVGQRTPDSMLGAAHACANPLTAQFDVTHGIAVSLMLPHVVRWNAEVVGDLYAELMNGPESVPARAGPRLADELEAVAAACGFPPTLRAAGTVSFNRCTSFPATSFTR